MVLRKVGIYSLIFPLLFLLFYWIRTDCRFLPSLFRTVSRFDPQGFSVWRVDFKYPEELTQVFMSSNQIGGFFSMSQPSSHCEVMLTNLRAQTDWRDRENTYSVPSVCSGRRTTA
jgi:Elongation factor 1 gamma, conserved domain